MIARVRALRTGGVRTCEPDDDSRLGRPDQGVVPMRRLAALLAACAMVTASLPASAVAQATPAHESFSFPFEFSGWNSCSGENVAFSGRFSGQVTNFQDASGGVHFTAHQLLTAQGQGNLGNRYSFSDTLSTSVHFDSDSAPF